MCCGIFDGNDTCVEIFDANDICVEIFDAKKSVSVFQVGDEKIDGRNLVLCCMRKND